MFFKGTKALLPPVPQKEETVVAVSAKRLLAFLVDYAVIMLFLKGIRPLFLPELWDRMDFATIIWSQIPLLLIGFALFVVRDSMMGISIGKAFFNLRVSNVDEKFSQPEVKRLWLRNLFLLLLPLEVYYLVTDRYCRRWGDRYAGTIVVEKKSPPQVRHVTVKVIGSFLTIACLWMVVTFITPIGIKKSTGYRMAEQAALEDASVFEQVGEVESIGYWPDVSYFQDKIVYLIRLEANQKEHEIQVIVDRTKEPHQVSKVMIIQGEKD